MAILPAGASRRSYQKVEEYLRHRRGHFEGKDCPVWREGLQLKADVPQRLADALPNGWELSARAPGRANLIGEHTDYNDGFVLPVALDMSTYLAGRPIDGEVRLRSLDQPGEVVVDVSTGSGPRRGWAAYVTGVVRALLDASVSLRGFEGVIASDVPAGSGLSSSAALEVAVASAVVDQPLDPVGMAEICQRAENVYVGVQCGIMDQLASAAGRAGYALFIDCRSHEVEAVPVPDRLRILVIDSAIRRGLGESAYNERRARCEGAAKLLGVRALRDATLDLLEEHRASMDATTFRRARHVIGDNDRVVGSVEALRRGDVDALGELFAASHTSYARDFEASTPEIDALVHIAQSTPGVVGARLTGGGFGGCTVNLVHRQAADEAGARIAEEYAARTGKRARWWVSAPAQGAQATGPR